MRCTMHAACTRRWPPTLHPLMLPPVRNWAQAERQSAKALLCVGGLDACHDGAEACCGMKPAACTFTHTASMLAARLLIICMRSCVRESAWQIRWQWQMLRSTFSHTLSKRCNMAAGPQVSSMPWKMMPYIAKIQKPPPGAHARMEMMPSA